MPLGEVSDNRAYRQRGKVLTTTALQSRGSSKEREQYLRVKYSEKKAWNVKISLRKTLRPIMSRWYKAQSTKHKVSQQK